MTGPRLTTPASKLARSISTTTPAAVPRSTTLLTTSKSAAPLSRKYADLLNERTVEPDHPRHLYTRSSNRPHPPPNNIRLMQPFSSTAAQNAQAADSISIDRVIFPGSAALEGSDNDPFIALRMPLLPDSFMTQHPPENEEVSIPEATIVAADPTTVASYGQASVQGVTLDGVELKFAHEAEGIDAEQGGLTGTLKGLIDNVFGEYKGKGTPAM